MAALNMDRGYMILQEHNYFHCNLDVLKNLWEHVAELERRKEDLMNENETLKREMYTLKKDKCSVDINRILNSMLLKFYTGFSSGDTLNIFTEILEGQCKLFYSKNRKNQNQYSFKVNFKNQIIIVLMRLRLGLLETDLADRFGISTPTVSRMVMFWINIMYVYLIQLPIWPSRTLIEENMPECFKKLYPSTRVILDATELFIESPSDYITQSSTYSIYKSHNTAKGVIGITPNGFLSFVSELYPGRTSDKEIILRSDLLEQLHEGDSVMADRGFTLEEELRKKGCDLNIPPFLDGASQLDYEREQKTRDIARTERI